MTYQSLVDFQYWTLIAQICNFFIQIYLFKRFLFKPVKEIIAKRQAEVDNIYQDADKANEAAQNAKATYEEHLQNAHAEAERITANAIESAKLRTDEMVKTAQHDAAAMREKATREISLERRKAMEDVKSEISDIAIEIASKVVEKEINASDHNALIEQFIDELGD